MADENSGKKNSPGGKFEFTTEMRLLLAFGLMGLVLFGTQYLLPKQQPAPKSQPVAQQPVAQAPAPAPAPAPAAVRTAKGPGKKPGAAAEELPPAVAETEETVTIESDVYRIVFSNRGAIVRSWTLKKYLDSDGKPVELARTSVAAVCGWPFSYVFPQQQPKTDLNKALFVVKRPDPLTVEFDYGDGATRAHKVFRFESKLYKSWFRSEVTSDGQPLAHQLAWRGGFGDRSVHNEADTQHSVYYDTAKSKLVTESASAAKNGPVTVTGIFDFAGLEDTYFAAVALPPPGASVDFTTWDDKVPAVAGGEDKPHVGISLGAQGSPEVALFIGPKDTNIMRATDRKLQVLIDWGWFWFIAKPLFMALHWVDENLTSNWGWAIILVTVVINLLMLPLRFSQLRSTQKMAVIQPQIQAVQAKYKNIPMRDPRKQKQNEELMALYQKNGINPMGGCFPLLLQMPFFIAFYKVLSVSIELRGASWLWVTDLSQPETLPIRMLPVGMLISQVAMQKMTPAASPDPSQQRMMMILMPIMLTVMFYGASSGLVLYWLTGNVVGIAQQYFFNRVAAHPAPAPASVAKKK